MLIMLHLSQLWLEICFLSLFIIRWRTMLFHGLLKYVMAKCVKDLYQLVHLPSWWNVCPVLPLVVQTQTLEFPQNTAARSIPGPQQCLYMCKYLEQNDSVAMLAAKMSAGVAPEINLMNQMHACMQAAQHSSKILQIFWKKPLKNSFVNKETSVWQSGGKDKSLWYNSTQMCCSNAPCTEDDAT